MELMLDREDEPPMRVDNNQRKPLFDPFEALDNNDNVNDDGNNNTCAINNRNQR